MFELLHFAFIQRALLSGSFIALACSLLGVFLVLRRYSLIGDGLSHASFAAIGLGLFLGFYPLLVALPIVILASFGILKLTEKAGLYGDAAIGLVSAVGIASGVMLASLDGGFNVDLFSYLFGSILSISPLEVWLSIVVSLVVVAVIIFYYHELFAITFDETYAKITGIKTNRINYLFVMLTAMTVVLGIKVAGTMLVSSLIIFPAITALQVAAGFKAALALASVLGVLSVVLGVFISFAFNLPTGATIVLVSFVFFMIALTYQGLKK